MNKDFREFIEIAILGALAFGLGMIKVYKMPNGGSVSLEMLPVVIMAFRRGPKAGILTGLLLAALQMTLDGYVIRADQVIYDYFFAFGVIGLASIFGRKNTVSMVAGIVLVCTLRFISHVIAGVVVWEVDWVGSIVYNGPYMLLSTILVVAVMLLISKRKEIMEVK